MLIIETCADLSCAWPIKQNASTGTNRSNSIRRGGKRKRGRNPKIRDSESKYIRYKNNQRRRNRRRKDKRHLKRAHPQNLNLITTDNEQAAIVGNESPRTAPISTEKEASTSSEQIKVNTSEKIKKRWRQNGNIFKPVVNGKPDMANLVRIKKPGSDKFILVHRTKLSRYSKFPPSAPNTSVKQNYREYQRLRDRNKFRHRATEFGIGTLNVKTFKDRHRIYETWYQAHYEHGLGIVAIQEHRIMGKDGALAGGMADTPIILEDGAAFYYSFADRTSNQKNTVGGIGVIVGRNCLQSICFVKSISPRILHISFSRGETNASRNGKLHVIIVYSPTATVSAETRVNSFYAQLGEVVASIPDRDMIIVTGDFNATLTTGISGALFGPSSEKQNLNSKHLHEFMEMNALLPISARFGKRSSHEHFTFNGPKDRRARLDHILINKKWSSSFRNVKCIKASVGTDHRLLCGYGCWRLRRQDKRSPAVKHDYSVLRTDEGRATYEQTFSSLYTPAAEMTENYSGFASACAESRLTIPTFEKRDRKYPWMDGTVSALRASKRAAQMVYRNDPTARNKRAIYGIAKQMSERYIANRLEYIDQQCQLIESAMSENQLRRAYGLIHVLSGKASRSGVKIAADSPTQRLNIMRNHFETVLSSAQHPEHAANLPGPAIVFPYVHNEFKTSPFTMYELKEAIAGMSSGKAPGIDNITAEELRMPALFNPTLTILNQALAGREVPTEWKTLVIIPVPKKGDLSQPTNYRGISLMCLQAKLYNKILLMRLRKVLEKKLRVSQNGFRPNRSTVSQVTALRIIFEQSRSHRDLSLLITFIDFSKAFDSINWEHLYFVLRAYGVPTSLIQAIMALYEPGATTARVRLEGCLSDPFDLNCGVLQGDTLAPYLFVIVLDYALRRALDGLPDDISLPPPCASGLLIAQPVDRTEAPGYNTRSRARRNLAVESVGALGCHLTDMDFADDIALITASNTDMGAHTDEGGLANLREQAQLMLQRVEAAAGASGLRINGAKTEVIYLPRAARKAQPGARPSELLLSDGTPLQFVDEFKYLGSLIADQDADIRERTNKAWVEAKRLRRVWIAGDISAAVKHRLLCACILSVMLYGSESWTLTPARISRLSGAHTKLLRYCLNKPFAEHPTIEELRGGRLSINQMIIKRRMTMIGKVWRSSIGDRIAPQALADVLFWKPDTPHFGQEGLTYLRQLEVDYEGGLSASGADSYRKEYSYSDLAAKQGKITAALSNEKEWLAIIARRIEGVGLAEMRKIEARRQSASRRASNVMNH